MKKKLLMLLVLALWVGKTYAQSQVLVLHHPGGTTTDVELYTQPRIEFKGDRVVITSPVLDMEYAAEDILRFTYKGKGTSGISSPQHPNVNSISSAAIFLLGTRIILCSASDLASRFTPPYHTIS